MTDDETPAPVAAPLDRRHVSVAQMATLFMLMLQLGALVWGAATLKAAVDNLQNETADIRQDVRALTSSMQTLTLDVGILKVRFSR